MKEIKCKCFVTEDMWTSSDVLWGPRVEFSMLAQSTCQKYRKCTAKLTFPTRRRPVAHLFHSWMGKRIERFLIPSLLRDEEKIAKCCAKSDNDVNERDSFEQHSPLLTNYLVEEPWILESSIVSHHVADLDNSVDNNNERDVLKYTHGDKSDDDVNERDSFERHSPLLTNYLVEEPWIFESSIAPSTVNMASNVLRNEFDEDEVTQSTLNKQDQPIPENMLHVEESNAMTKEDSVATVILINSSMCTFQRIAVLENDKLVELLLEPVKTNVQSDSVFLGVVTKLVPHMGGAFVNIGSPRLALMGIKPHWEPFIFDSFHGPVKGREVNGSIFSKAEEQVDFHENEALSSGVDEPDEVEDEQSDDEFNNNEFEGHENRFLFNVIEAIKENANGSVVEHEREANKLGLFGQQNGYADQLQTKSAHQDASINGVGTEENKWARVKRGSKIIVQVVKEGLGTKGPTLTAYPKLKSRFWILMTRCNRIGISKKISGAERGRLRVIAKTLQPSGFGLTVRTVASGHSMEELRRDLEGLLSTWRSIMDHATSAALAADEGVDGAVPVMLHRAMGQTLSVVQDYFNEKVKSMVVDSPQTYNEVTTYLQDIAPCLCDRIELYTERTPLFDEYNIEEEINNILSKRVPLADGGYLVIEQTEALVSIDVNGGQRMLGQGTSQEKAVLQVNLAAARQIARELRLRDIGGIIVVDFIDMLDDSYKRLVYEEVKKAVERDRSTVKVSELSRHWLMEITRKRVRPSIPSMISEPCTCCHATGRVQALEAIFSKIELEICRLLSKMDQKADPESPRSWPRFVIRVDQHMCTFLTTGKRTRLAVLSSSLKVWILLKVARGFTRGGFELKPLTDENVDKNQNDDAAISVLRPKEVVTYSSRGRKVTLFPIKKYKTAGD